MVGLKIPELPGGEGAPCDLNAVCTVGRAASVGTGPDPTCTHMHMAVDPEWGLYEDLPGHGLWSDVSSRDGSGTRGAASGARGHGSSGRVRDLTGLTQQSQV